MMLIRVLVSRILYHLQPWASPPRCSVFASPFEEKNSGLEYAEMAMDAEL